jgi:hypothetical protein
MLGCEDSTDVLRDNLYLLLERDKIQKLPKALFIVPDRKTTAGGDARQIFRQPEKVHVAP